MIDRLRSVVNVESVRPLTGFISSNSEERESVDGPLDGTPGGDAMWTPEERILELLNDNGGRMWQQSIVSETGYSEAQVSRLLCKLEKHGIVDRHWSGGEKVVVLDREPAEVSRSELLSPT